jgi:hypothetical protein
MPGKVESVHGRGRVARPSGAVDRESAIDTYGLLSGIFFERPQLAGKSAL